ncbi:glutathione S-transferase [Usnea florida]
MSSQLQPIKVWGKIGPNPPKVAILLGELGLPHEIDPIPLSDVKKPEYLAVNPNGRIPAIYDPNTDITLWESGAILEYLVERYDTEHRFSFAPGTPEYYHAKQWLHFQVSGQGPYYGQLFYFKRYHPEPVPSANERYAKEINRVSGVLEGHLAQQKQKYGGGDADGPWLVGNKYSYVDIAFVVWQALVGHALGKDEYDVDSFPHVKEWLGNMTEREMVKAALEIFKQMK